MFRLGPDLFQLLIWFGILKRPNFSSILENKFQLSTTHSMPIKLEWFSIGIQNQASNNYNEMLRQSLSGKVIFSLQHFIALALDVMPRLQGIAIRALNYT